MGLFDGFEAGWNSFKNNELKQVGDWAVSLVPDSKKKEVVDWISENPEKAIKAKEKPVDVAVEQLYKVKSGKVNISPILDDTMQDTLLPDVGVTPVVPLGDTGPIVKEEAATVIKEGGETVIKFVNDASDNIGKYWPVIAAGGVALLLITALK